MTENAPRIRVAAANRNGPPTVSDRTGNLVELVALLQAFRRMRGKLGRLASRLSDALEEVETAEAGMKDLVRRLSGAEALPSRRRPVRSPEETRVFGAEAKGGVMSLQIKRYADGTGEVSVNGRQSFMLPPKLAALLAILVAVEHCADDGLMGWLSRADVAKALNKKTGGSASPTSVPKLVFKIRKAFFDAGENGFVIERNRVLGVRVALRG